MNVQVADDSRRQPFFEFLVTTTESIMNYITISRAISDLLATTYALPETTSGVPVWIVEARGTQHTHPEALLLSAASTDPPSAKRCSRVVFHSRALCCSAAAAAAPAAPAARVPRSV